MFRHTLRRLRRVDHAAARVTPLATLLEAARDHATIRPSGIIFHVSRCGSTFLANTLKTGDAVLVLSEARPICSLLHARALTRSPFPPEGRAEGRKLLLESVTTLYGHSMGRNNPKVIFKCHSATMMFLPWIRQIWPEVPFVVMIRNPVEVIQSNLAKQARWLRCRQKPKIAKGFFHWSEGEIRAMSAEEFCARGYREVLRNGTQGTW